jgi:drug/metabolite transporter (DMT)-like permease
LLKNLIARLKSDERFFVVLLIFAMAVWGGSWTSAKLIANTVHPLVLTFLRFFVTFLCFVPAVAIRRQSLKIDLRSLLFTAAAAVLMNLYSFLFFAGLEPGRPGSGGVLVTTLNPVFTFALSLLIYKKRIGPKAIVGLALGVAGGLVLLHIWNASFAGLLSSGNFMFVIASAVWALLTIISGEAQKKTPLFVFGFYMYGISTLIGFGCALPFGLEQAFRQSPTFWLNILYLGAASTFFATSVYFFAAKKISANRASSFSLFVPVFAVLASLFVLGEIPTIFTVIGGAIAMIGIYLINRKAKARPPRSESEATQPKSEESSAPKNPD